MLTVTVAAGIGAAAVWPVRMPAPRAVDWGRHVVTPERSRRVLWVGHSLMNHRDPDATPPRNLPEVVEAFAQASGVSYAGLDHTLFGSPLSLLWRGAAHGFARSEPAMLRRREQLMSEAGAIDAVVMTELIPVRAALRNEHSAYYAQAFACGVIRHNPRARIYVYETWSHLHASDAGAGYGAVSTFDWSRRLAEDRAYFEQLADLASTGQVPAPGLLARIQRPGRAVQDCQPTQPIMLVPVGTVFRALAELLKQESLEFEGRRMTTGDLFANAYTSWPAGWPLPTAASAADEAKQLAALKRRFPDRPADDVHPSQLGIYVAGLVHFATLFGASPVDLPNDVRGLPDASARRLQTLAWDKVRTDPRTGVR